MSSPEAAVAEAVFAPLSRFSVHARAEPGVMPRMLELFAKRGLVPERWHSTVVRPDMRLAVDIEIGGLEREMVEYMANCMRQITGVELVLTV
jgi:hypothetical protein